VENNQVAMPSSAPPPWLAGLLKLPGYSGQTASKGDGVIADPATELDPTIKAGTPIATPSGSGVIDDIFRMPPGVEVAKRLVDYVPTAVKGGDGDKSTFWSSTKDKTPVENAYGHSTKHGDEFPEYQNSMQYVQAAQDFVNNPPDGTLTKTRPNGDTLYYDPATNTFASKTKDGAPKRMFKPAAGMDYWNKQ
jgi:filamentous hemagglutinin